MPGEVSQVYVGIQTLKSIFVSIYSLGLISIPIKVQFLYHNLQPYEFFGDIHTY